MPPKPFSAFQIRLYIEIDKIFLRYIKIFRPRPTIVHLRSLNLSKGTDAAYKFLLKRKLAIKFSLNSY